jgi:cytochrome c553
MSALVLAWLLCSPAARGDTPALVPICAGCHGEDGRSSAMPGWGRVAGQHYEYLVYVLKLYRSGGRSGLNAGLMSTYARALSDAQIAELARYYANLKD